MKDKLKVWAWLFMVGSALAVFFFATWNYILEPLFGTEGITIYQAFILAYIVLIAKYLKNIKGHKYKL